MHHRPTLTSDSSFRASSFVAAALLVAAALASQAPVEGITVLAQDPASRDWGDAPPQYPTTLGQNGARHLVSGVDPLRLGATVDVEADGQPSALASADGNPDEDGVALPAFFAGVDNVIEVEAVGGAGPGAGSLNAFFDFNRDGDWSDAGERVLVNATVSGVTKLTIPVPAGSSLGTTFARFRLSQSQTSLGFSGEAPDGEVEDYAIRICDAPAPPNCCRHVMLVLDRSASMSGAPLSQEIAGGTDFINLMNMPPSRVGLVSFANNTVLEQRLTQTKTTVIQALRSITAGGKTFIGPAINAAQGELAAGGVATCGDIMIIVSDGQAGDGPAANAAAAGAKAAGTRLFVVGMAPNATAEAFLIGLASSQADYRRANSPQELHDAFFSLRWEICDVVAPAPCRPVGSELLTTSDLGDAPDSTNHFGRSMTSYGAGTTAGFPTVFDSVPGAIRGPIHIEASADLFLGANVSAEDDADLLPDDDLVTNIKPSINRADRDWGDDGVTFPLSLPNCGQSTFSFDVTVRAGPSTRYVNAWLDLSRDGDWDDTLGCVDPDLGALTVPEWIVQDQAIVLAQGVHELSSVVFNSYHPNGLASDVWMRVTVSEAPAVAPHDGRGPMLGFLYGETEDYLLRGSGAWEFEPQGEE